MYSKYEEMRVMKQTIQNYANNQKYEYDSIATSLKENINKLDINSNITSLNRDVAWLSVIQNDYKNAMSVVSELNKATMCYEQAYTPEQLQQGGIAEERAKEGNRIFYEIRTQNPEYKRIVDEIAYDLFANQDPHVVDLRMDFDTKEKNLEKEFEEGKISKEQLIYYVNMCWSLLQNPNYIKYMNQNENENEQGIHR